MDFSPCNIIIVHSASHMVSPHRMVIIPSDFPESARWTAKELRQQASVKYAFVVPVVKTKAGS